MKADDRGVTDAVPLDTLVGYHLRRASTVFSNHFTQAMSGTGLRQVLFGILSIIDANPGINQGSVGRELGIQRANMVTLINELVEQQFIDRQMAEDDRRAFAFSLTSKGRAKLTDALARVRAHEEHLLSALTTDERTVLIDMLKRIEDVAPEA